MTVEHILLQYQDRLQQIQTGSALLLNRQYLTGAVLILAVTLLLVFGLSALVRQTRPAWYAPLPLPVALFCSRRYSQQRAVRSTLRRLRDSYTRGVTRLQEQWIGHGDSGAAYLTAGHVFAHDLNLFGRGSLFERLCTCRTELGKRKLAAYLQQQPPPMAECLARQAAVRELQHNTDLREEIATLGHEFHEASPATTEWLARAPIGFPALARALAIASTVAVVLLLVSLSWTALLALLAAQTAFGWFLRRRVLTVIGQSRAVFSEIRIAREGLALLARQSFTAGKLAALVGRIQDADRALRPLERYFWILDERSKESFYAPSTLFLTGTHCAFGIEAWRLQHAAALADWLDVWAEFEALNALACYAYESPGHVFPEFSAGAAAFEAEALGHPVLPAASCVTNDVRLHAEGPALLLISGSNMAGKSTLLRSIGVNTVLAGAGAPVRAARLSLTPFSLCASLSIQDALGEGKSRFLAEVERLRAAIELARSNQPLLFLIDEIFSGTNSRDRRIAAEAVVRTLTGAGAVGAVSTHDLALTEIAALPEVRGVNVHMGARTAGDPLDFDYRLKPGVTEEANALAIARLAGVPV